MRYLALVLGSLLVWAGWSFAAVPLGGVYTDLDRDGYKEGYLVYEGKTLVKSFIDSDKDQRVDTIVHYKNGARDRAERDEDGDGYIDTWVSYYFTGVPWKITEDGDRDGSPDYWVFFKDGQAYKWEQDRNHDGRADVQTMLDGSRKITRQLTDDDYDGFYEHLKGRVASAHLYPQSLAEALLR